MTKKISKYLDPDLVAFLDETSRNDVLMKMVDLIEASNRLIDKQSFLGAIMDREKIVSTGIGMGVSIPHAKLPTYDDFFIVIGVLSKGIDWNAIDGAPVRLVFMIGGPDDQQTEYLQILSALTQALKNEDRRKKILAQQTAEGIIELFKGF